ncbi:hypothetical protein HOO68_05940 [Candidatus Gracilibacteria bacterium]|nr:hypothetical protein [Candidatus Gracilibacteria bacterium]
MRRRRNPPSSKADVVEALLRLGDVARNSQIGEVQTALGKAKLLIDKYGLIQFDGRYQQLVEKMAAHLRGEKVERDDTGSQQQRRQSSHQSYHRETGGTWQDHTRRGYTQEEREQTARAARQARQERRRRQEAAEDHYRRERAARKKARRDAVRAQKKAQQAETKRRYVRPSRVARIVWLWTLKDRVPKRGKAGERWKAYYGAETVEEMLARGGKWSDVRYNVLHGYMNVIEDYEA